METQRFEEGGLLSNRYEIVEIVGRGGMGTVYRAQDRRLDITVAVKEMIERDVPDEEREAAVRQFEREAKLLGQLSHPNLPRVTDYFVEDDHCYLIMEFVVGRTLDTLLREANGQALPLHEVLHWGVQLADVLAYLHGQDPPIVFRDIKPANIMVQADGLIKLIDFGIARRFHPGATKDTLLYGSPGYSPPEQYGRGQTDPRSDIYALGATLHHLVTGRDPAPTPFKFPPIRTLDPSLPIQLDIFLSRCLEMDENRRCQSAAEAQQTLLEIRAIVTASAAAPPRPASGAPPVAGPAPKIISSRLSRARDALLVRRLLMGAVILLALVTLGTAAIKMRPHHRPAPQNSAAGAIRPPVGTGDVPPNSTPSADTQNTTGSDQQMATIQVSSIPSGAAVVLDGKPYNSTPMQMTQIAPGPHTLELVPPKGSGYAVTVRTIEVQPGQNMQIDTTLAAVGDDTAAASTEPTAEVQRVDTQEVSLPDTGQPGLRLAVTLRVRRAIGAKCMVAIFFFDADKQTSLQAQTDAPAYRNDAGALYVSKTITPDADPEDYVELPLYIPKIVFPGDPGRNVTFHVVVYINGTVAVTSDIYSLLQPQG